ncbi:hypothetical protein BB561_001889 [Smittium simulii]|uniref:3-hydroxyisobutyrate dehydrogenase n=1 Tax=Smittium simulii TaxID=133385 RepID=A0A2T9YSI5_9FUNG|nr:hypothetical protein BB561_001889 [Smittium simulii]
MGHHMASNLLKNSDFSLVVYDINPTTISQFVELSSENKNRVQVASSLKQLASESDTILTMLPESSHVKAAYCSENGLLSGLSKNTICIDSSTIDTSVSIEVSNSIAKHGGIPFDAPVSGGVMGAKAASLTFMVGSRTAAEFDVAKSILLNMGKNIVYCGDLGSGQTVKICNNMLLGSTMIAAAEAMNLGVKLGVDPKLLADVINTSSGRCWSTQVANPHPNVVPTAPSNNDYNDGFGASLMLKDMYLSMNAAKSSGSSVMMAALATQIYRATCNIDDLAHKDFSSVYKLISKK